ncbi:Synaptotagmin-2 [Tritrichomonas musculus]|uniref:Synaptotagmin-2 n=1 Tax=Tritrichomonas musculus TaxID=1915356 RepID=A0ABR2GV83_9EUKA
MELHIKVIEARNVPAADLNGKSDPYVSLSTEKTKSPYQKTKVLKKTLSPKWDEEFTIKVNFVSDILSVVLYDHDTLSADDKLGLMDIRIHDLNIGLVEDRWYKMNPPKKSKPQPEIHLITHLTYEGQVAWKNLNLLFIDCMVRVIEAKNLPKMDADDSDPYCQVTISTDTEKWCSTKTIKNNNNPKWDESFLFWVTNPTCDRLLFKIYDKDILIDDSIGTLEIPLVSLRVGFPIEKWFDIVPNKNGTNAGQIKLYICMSPKGTQWTGNPTPHPRYEQAFKLHPDGMPKDGFPPEGGKANTFPMPQLPPPQ